MSATEIIREGEIVEVKIRIRIPVVATAEQVDEWLNFETVGGSISAGNPLSAHGLEDWGTSGLEWKSSGFVGTRDESEHEVLPDGSMRCRVRYREVRI